MMHHEDTKARRTMHPLLLAGCVVFSALFWAGLIAAAAILLGGCAGLEGFDHSYSVSYSDGKTTLSGGVTLHPRAARAGRDAKTIKPLSPE
ncbi:MAG: hypothetical protein WC069_07220 [Candidatus Shapirobacteria bacterium]